jgi:Cu/Ag efflux protein CusF
MDFRASTSVDQADESAGGKDVPGKEVIPMDVARSIFVALVTMLLASMAPSQALATSHQAAGQEKKAEKAGKAAAPATGRHVGSVKAVDPAAGTLTVTEKAGDAEVSVSDKTAIKKGKASVKLADLKAGDEVTVVYVKQDGKDVARSVTVKAK